MEAHDNYDEFVVQIGARVGDYYPATVLRSPVGTGGSGQFPVRDFLHAVPGEETTSSATGITRDVEDIDAPVPLPPERVGRELFDALFTGEIKSLFERSLGRVSASNGRLRVRLHLNVGNETIAPLAALPWELMFRQDRRAFLALSPDTTFVRSLDVPIDLYEMKEVQGPLPVLFVMANPKGDLNLGAERMAIEAQLAAEARTSGGPATLRAHFLENATFSALEELLHREDFTVIHFMGHGTMSANGEGHLLFHDGVRSGRDIGELLKNEPTTRLVTLNACNTAATSRASGADPFAGVAAALVMAGVPAVIAMQFPVSDGAAIAFSARLYSELGNGRSIEASVDSGRRKIKAMRPEQHEWATPVLFLRDPSLMPASAPPRRKRGPTGDVIVPRVDTDGPQHVVDEKQQRGRVLPPRLLPASDSGSVPERSVSDGGTPKPTPIDGGRTRAETKPARKWKTYYLIGLVACLALAAVGQVINGGFGANQSPEEPPLIDGGLAAQGQTPDGPSPNAPTGFAPRIWSGLGMTATIASFTLNGTQLTGDNSHRFEMAPEAMLEFGLSASITKEPVETCTTGDCPARLYMMLTRPEGSGAEECSGTPVTRSAPLEWRAEFKAPVQPGVYSLQLVASAGAVCRETPPLLTGLSLAEIVITR